MHTLLKCPADSRTIAFVLIYYVLTWLLWNGVGNEYISVRLLLFLACSLFSFVCAVITHNFQHHPIFHSTAANNIFRCILSFSYGHPVGSFIPGHNLSHHAFTQSPRDFMRTTKVCFRWNFFNGLLFQPLVSSSVLRSDVGYFLLKKGLRRIGWQIIFEVCVVLFASTWLIWMDWRKFLLAIHLPHAFAQWGIVTMNLLQHDGCDHSLVAGKISVNGARNFTSWTVNYFFLNNGYHTIHHWRPHLHWSLLPDAHCTEVAPFCHPNLCQSSMVAYIFHTFIYPGERRDYLGKKMVITPSEAGVDQKWY